MAWDGSKNSGFTDEDCEPWLLPHSRAAEVNVEADLASDRSVYRFYQELIRLRLSDDAFTFGDLEVISEPSDDHFIFIRRACCEAEESGGRAAVNDAAGCGEKASPGSSPAEVPADHVSEWVVVCNFEEEQRIELPFACGSPALSNLGRKTMDGIYAPYECAAARIIR